MIQFLQSNMIDPVLERVINDVYLYLGVGWFIALAISLAAIYLLFQILIKRVDEKYRVDLDKSKFTELDLLFRRREVYSRLIKSMWVFLQKADDTVKSNEKEKNEFLVAYDEMYIWAPDDILDALGKLINLKRIWAKKRSEVKESGKKLEGEELLALQFKYRELHTECLKKIREECGFIETKFKYRYVSF